ncbi:hypothetical protein KIN20_026155 [Parelaphostrongylus tenuis]|uniref:Uncharacterized protein n=1 Tax=Parelaphostrongylus tenuis TaxID=148309 RepID=A0AAD5NCE6_PARTN|nr:hypothetical protein KIN20_026155 [Parelaphostrongylus tenuis]
MNTDVAAFILTVLIFAEGFKLGYSQDPEIDDTSDSHGYVDKIDECNSDSIVDEQQRVNLLVAHNGRRYELQEEGTQNGPEESSTFQSAKDMTYMAPTTSMLSLPQVATRTCSFSMKY